MDCHVAASVWPLAGMWTLKTLMRTRVSSFELAVAAYVPYCGPSWAKLTGVTVHGKPDARWDLFVDAVFVGLRRPLRTRVLSGGVTGTMATVVGNWRSKNGRKRFI